ncbi:MAG: hypothetical protein HY973_02575 [Candidatus Kerfeldbacteria bacterium]|nr:hypothetical protein [Candidatus Kerfeldbacteria bacterium]
MSEANCACGLPLTEATKCTCQPEVCVHCCTCQPGCECNCETKRSE